MLNQEAVSAVSVGPDAAGARAVAVRCARIVPAILAGSSGTRLWPVSRERYPKQLIDVVGSNSLLQATVRRMEGFPAPWQADAAPIIVCREEHRFVIAEQLRTYDVDARLVVESARRDTARALTHATSLACTDSTDAILVVMPANHSIVDVPALQGALDYGARYAEQGSIAMLGERPIRPDPGFGYIRIGAELSEGGCAIDAFVKKAAEEVAAQYLAPGTYWSNSGIFIVRAKVWLDTLKRLQPEMHAACERAFAGGHPDDAYFRPQVDPFLAVEGDLIDCAVMERLTDQDAGANPSDVVGWLDAGSSDLGSLDAGWAAMENDANGNAGRGRVTFEGGRALCPFGRPARCQRRYGQRGAGRKTADAVLVIDHSHVQDVKGLVSCIRAQRAPEADEHRKVRLCGVSTPSTGASASRSSGSWSRRAPGFRCSYHRAEHRVVVRDWALVTRGEKQFLPRESESTFIPLGTRHRLENSGKVPLEFNQAPRPKERV